MPPFSRDARDADARRASMRSCARRVMRARAALFRRCRGAFDYFRHYDYFHHALFYYCRRCRRLISLPDSLMFFDDTLFAAAIYCRRCHAAFRHAFATTLPRRCDAAITPFSALLFVFRLPAMLASAATPPLFFAIAAAATLLPFFSCRRRHARRFIDVSPFSFFFSERDADMLMRAERMAMKRYAMALC